MIVRTLARMRNAICVGLAMACAALAAAGRAQAIGDDEVARGSYLARAGGCMACHTAADGESFAGGPAIRTPFGTFYSPNITPDPETGVGRWSSEDFWHALHDGQSRDGTLLYPAFPYPSYTKVTRADSDAMFRFIQTLKPVRQQSRSHDLPFPYNRRTLLLAWRALYFEPGEFAPRLDQSPEWNRGAYLVQGLGHCDACHTSRNMLGATIKGQQFAGGVIPIQEWYAPSLTANGQAGLGQWDVTDIVALLRTGVSRRGAVFGPMAQVVYDSLQHLTETDVHAIAVYLKSLPQTDAPQAPVQVRPTEAQSKSAFTAGRKLYDTHCKSCHGDTGNGAPPAYPPLANNQAINMDFAVNAIRMVLFGGFPPGTEGNPRPFGMPPFAYILNDQDVAAVVTYIRQAWRNEGGPISSAEVAKYRKFPSD